MDVEQLIEAEMAEYSDAAYADHGSARDQLKRFAALVRNEVLEEAAVQCDTKHAIRSGDGFAREASTARALAKEIRSMKTEVKP